MSSLAAWVELVARHCSYDGFAPSSVVGLPYGGKKIGPEVSGVVGWLSVRHQSMALWSALAASVAGG